MKKILLLSDALNFKAETAEFAAYIVKHGDAKLVALFIDHATTATHPEVRALGGTIYLEEVAMTVEEAEQYQSTLGKNIALFRDTCAVNGVDAIIHERSGSALDDIKEDTRYADLVIADPTLLFSEDDNVPTAFIKKLLRESECPVLIAPENFEVINEVVLAYDGSNSSIFAIKQFSYLLPELTGRKVTILNITDEDALNAGNDKFTEWLDSHFNNLEVVTLPGDPGEELFKYFIDNNWNTNMLLVTGAYGRNMLSLFFKPSAIDLVLKAVDIPIFVAHH